MAARLLPALIVHGGAGARGPAAERPRRRSGMLAATRRGVELLRAGASALDAVVATVKALEDDEYFNAGYGSVLNTDGRVEMDAALMVAEPRSGEGGARKRRSDRSSLMRAGAVAAVSRVRNPILLARAVMEQTEHILMVGAGAERIARRAGIALCGPDELITPRAKARWRLLLDQRLAAAPGVEGGTVGAAAIDSKGVAAAATSTGGMTGKLPGRVGDSALIGAGVYADLSGAASATGQGEAIILLALCREAVRGLERGEAAALARGKIAELARRTERQAGIIVVDHRGCFGFAHNAGAMEVASFDPVHGLRHYWPDPIG
jgi:beta-aspartyl-peptidase (threonine type)